MAERLIKRLIYIRDNPRKHIFTVGFSGYRGYLTITRQRVCLCTEDFKRSFDCTNVDESLFSPEIVDLAKAIWEERRIGASSSEREVLYQAAEYENTRHFELEEDDDFDADTPYCDLTPDNLAIRHNLATSLEMEFPYGSRAQRAAILMAQLQYFKAALSPFMKKKDETPPTPPQQPAVPAIQLPAGMTMSKSALRKYKKKLQK